MNSDSEIDFIGKIIFKKYQVLELIGVGSFGLVYKGKNTQENKLVAIKVEKISPEDCQVLKYETYVLANVQGFGIPKIISSGRFGNYNVLIFELLGKSLMDILKETGKLFTMKDICMIGIQMIDRIEFVHSRYFVHRDIKPDNFLIGYEDPSIIYLIDFGLSKKYRSSSTKKHQQIGLTKKLTGTLYFVSINANRGLVQSRRDDLESIGYVLLFTLLGELPWENMEKSNSLTISEKISLVYKIKSKVKPEKLCENLPQELTDYFKYCKKLKFEEKPDYNYLRGLFKSILDKNNFPLDNYFTWVETFGKTGSSNKKNKIKNSFRKRESVRTRLLRKIESNLQDEQQKCLNNLDINLAENDNNLFINKESGGNDKEKIIKSENSSSNIKKKQNKIKQSGKIKSEKKEISKIDDNDEYLFNSKKSMFNISIETDLDKESINCELNFNFLGINKEDIEKRPIKKENKIRKYNTANHNENINRKIPNKKNQNCFKNYNNTNFLTSCSDESYGSKNNFYKKEHTTANKSNPIIYSKYDPSKQNNNQKSFDLNKIEKFSINSGIDNNTNNESYKTFLINEISNYNSTLVNIIGNNENSIYHGTDGLNKDPHNYFGYNINNNKMLNYKNNKNCNRDYIQLNKDSHSSRNKNTYTLNDSSMNMRHGRLKNNILIMNNININQNISGLNNNILNDYSNKNPNQNTGKMIKSFGSSYFSNKLNTINYNG